MPAPIASEMVVLRPGFVVSRAAFHLLCNLERRELTIERDGEQLAVGPKTKLTNGDRAQIREHRDELLSLIDYVKTV